MALIKCPECKNNVSDKALVCPKCGYEIKKDSNDNNSNKKSDNKSPKFRGKIDYKYIILGLLIIVVGFHMLNQNNEKNKEQTPSNPQTEDKQNKQTTPGTNTGYIVYNDQTLKMSYEIPSNYKTFTEKNLTYVGQSIDNDGALIPYIVLGWDTNYANPVQFLNAFTDELRKVYSDVTITIDMLSNTLGNYYVYGIQYKYTSSGHTVIDNRYATQINGKIFMVGTKEENQNTEEINNVVRVIFNTLKGVN